MSELKIRAAVMAHPQYKALQATMSAIQPTSAAEALAAEMMFQVMIDLLYTKLTEVRRHPLHPSSAVAVPPAPKRKKRAPTRGRPPHPEPPRDEKR